IIQAQNIPSFDQGVLLYQQIQAEGAVSNTLFAKELQKKYGMDDQTAKLTASAVMAAVTGGIGAKGVKEKSSGNIDKRLPVSTPTVAQNGLLYKSNPKHTPGGEGNRPNAGIEPKNSLELFEKSISVSGDSSKRYSVDSKGNIHQFTYEGAGSNTYHWAGRTGGDQNSQQIMKVNTIPNEVFKHFGINPKKVNK
ncbi:hypothetical protein KTH11_18640, partial [Acinetobacter baumannii]|nr:hypothetical protein [Acinetobacter baumannii]